MKFSMKLTPKMESMLWGAVGGAAALAIIGFTFGGWVTGGKAKEMAQQQTDKAVTAALSPICVDKFRQGFLPSRLCAAARVEIGRRLLNRQAFAGAVDFPFPRVRRIGSQFCDQCIVFRVEVTAHRRLMRRVTEKRQTYWAPRHAAATL